MYFMKNSGCVIRKSQWITPNIIERNFKINLRKSRPKLPAEDPTKPPLRLNIPKDTNTPSPYNFNSEVKVKPSHSCSTVSTDSIGTDWPAPIIRLGTSKEENYLSIPNAICDQNRNSSEIQQKHIVSARSKSSDSSIAKLNLLCHPNGKSKNFKLKKKRNYETLTPKTGDDTFRELQNEGKTGILTIKFALNDYEGEKPATGMSPVATEVDVTSDEQIKALAEAIISELIPNGADVKAGNSNVKQDEAFLVIINVLDKDVPEETLELSQISKEGPRAELFKPAFDDGGYGAGLKVRTLDPTNENDKNVSKKNFGRSGTPVESDTPLVGSQTISRTLNSVTANAQWDAEFDRQVRDQTQYQTKQTLQMIRRSFKSAEDLTKEKEKRKKVFESTIRRIRATRSQSSMRRKIQIMDLSKKLSTVSSGNPVSVFIGSRLTVPVEFVTECSMQNETEKSKSVGEAEGKDNLTGKVVPSELVLLDLPEVVLHPDYKMLRKSHGEIKNLEDDKFKKARAVRSYHNSCKNMCKLTKDVGEEKAHVNIVNLDKKIGESGKGDNPKAGNVKPEPLQVTHEISGNKLDKACDVLPKSSDIPTLQIHMPEESVVSDKVRPTEKEITQKTNEIPYSAKGEDGLKDERYELDITDFKPSQKCASVKVQYSVAFPSKQVTALNEVAKLEIFKDMVPSSFEMNLKCLKMNEVAEKKSSDDSLKSDSPAVAEMETSVTTTPKISDNIANLANEDLTLQKGPTSVDSLSMMKKVKEMVEMDLKNAEKIFLAKDAEVPNPNEESTFTTPDDTSVLPKSVVIHNDKTNHFYIKANELEHAEYVQNQEMAMEMENLKILDFNQEIFHGDLGLFADTLHEPPNENSTYVLKTGDSILVYDDEKRQWNVDFGLLRDNEQKKEQPHEVHSDKKEISPPESLPEVPRKEVKEDPCLSRTIIPEVLPVMDKSEKGASEKEEELEKASALKRETKQSGKKVEERIQEKNSDLCEVVFTGLSMSDLRQEMEEARLNNIAKGAKKLDMESPPSEHYVSENIVEMSKNSTVKPRSNKVETVKVKIIPTERPPSKVTEINLNKKNEEGKGTGKKTPDAGNEEGKGKRDQVNESFYKKFEKYKTPFSDPDYEDKPMKINSDLKSNPNLKKLDSWNKTLVLHEISKPPDTVEGWLRDETDKMATLLLKVLQDAADGNSKRRVAAKMVRKGNPYEAIRKKQETNMVTGKGKKRESFFPARKRMLPVQMKKSSCIGTELTKAEEKNALERSKKGQFPIIEDDSHVEILTPDSHLPKEPFQVSPPPFAIFNEGLKDDIPGPYFMKKISSFWRYLPDLGCQTTIFLLTRIFNLAKTGLSVFSTEARKSRRNAFERLFMTYGPVVRLHGPLSGDIVLINRPEDLKSVFVQEKASPSRSVLDSVENCRVRARGKNIPFGISRFCMGTEWDGFRKYMIDVGNKGCLQYFNMLKNTDAMFLNKIQNIRNNQKQVPDDFISEVKKWSMEGLCGILFDKSLGFFEKKDPQIHWIAESERLMRHLGEATEHLCQCESTFQTWRFVTTPALRGLNQAYQSLDLIISKYVYEAELTLRKKKKALISDKSNSNKNLNFLESVLLNDKMTPEEITANLIDMLLIGVNTTTVALAFLLYNLAQNNRVQSLLFKEIKDLLPAKTSALNYHQLHSLKYLQACLKESMRINVPMPLLLKVLPSDIALANYRVPFGTHMVMDLQSACMREQAFDDPQKFKPERWLEQDCIHPFAFIPFSNGPRAEFIKRLAEIQLWTCIAQIVRNYQIEYHFGDIKSSKILMSYPDKPLRLTFIERVD